MKSDNFADDMPLVYLAGPIKGRTVVSAATWRAKARDFLGAYGIRTASPLRHRKTYLGAQYASTGHVAVPKFDEFLPPEAIKRVVMRDKWDVRRSDVVLVNLAAGDVSIGSCVEVGWADAADIPIVAVIPPGSCHDHGILKHLAVVAHDLQEALDIVAAMLT